MHETMLRIIRVAMCVLIVALAMVAGLAGKNPQVGERVPNEVAASERGGQDTCTTDWVCGSVGKTTCYVTNKTYKNMGIPCKAVTIVEVNTKMPRKKSHCLTYCGSLPMGECDNYPTTITTACGKTS